jgi:hypothetical protein
MSQLDKARKALRKLESVLNTSKVQVSEDGTRSIVKFDGLLIDPFDMLRVSAYVADIKEFLDGTQNG